MNTERGDKLQVKCRWCKQKAEKETMIKVEQGKSNMYYHPDCYKEYEKDKAFKEKERKELDELYETIKRIHGFEVIPSSFFADINALRNGDVLYGRIKKQYKKGVSYKWMNYTYLYCEDQIKWCIKNKRDKFKNKRGEYEPLYELRYCLGIVRNNLEKAKKHYKDKLKQIKQRQEVEDHVKMLSQIRQKINQASYNSEYNEENVDITSLFD